MKEEGTGSPLSVLMLLQIAGLLEHLYSEVLNICSQLLNINSQVVNMEYL